MDFPIIELLDEQASKVWIKENFHPEGLKCPHCGAGRNEAREFRETRESQLTVYRCHQCDGIYNLYSETIFEGSRLNPQQVILMIRGVLKGQPSTEMAREIGVSKPTVLLWRHRLQAQAEDQQSQTALPDSETEVDEVFQNAGKKGIERETGAETANSRGRGTFEGDRPPVVGTTGRESGQVRLRVEADTTQETLHKHVESFTQEEAQVYTDDYASYDSMDRAHKTVNHSDYQWARDTTGDGQRDTHTNTIEGRWADLRTFLRRFCEVSKHLLSGYIAIYELSVNLKVISVDFIAQLVGLHSNFT